MRKYICDRCGKTFEAEWHWSQATNGVQVPNLYTVSIYPNDSALHPDTFKIGEYCLECRNIIFKYLKGMPDETPA